MCVSHSVVSNSLRPHGPHNMPRLFCPWNSPGKILEWVAIPSPGNLPHPEIQPGAPALQADSLLLSHQGSPKLLIESESESEGRSVMSNSLWSHGLYSPWNFPGQNNEVGSHFLLQGIFQTQRLNPGLSHCR